MRIYISSHDKDLAITVRDLATEAKHEIVSTWHDGEFKRTAEYTEAERSAIAERNVEEIEQADVLVLIASEDKVPGGKFVEAGAAIAYGLDIYILGRVENMLLWHPCVKAFLDAASLVAALGEHASLFN